MDILERISKYFQGENDENHRKLLRDAMGTIRELRSDRPAPDISGYDFCLKKEACLTRGPTQDYLRPDDYRGLGMPGWTPLPKPGVKVTPGPQTNTYTIHKADPFSLFGGVEPVIGGIYAHKVSSFVTDGIGGPKVTAVFEYVRIG